MIKRLLALLVFILFLGCNRRDQVTRSFYYWKQDFSISTAEEKVLTDLKINKLFVRFFDVQWIEEEEEAYPVSKINFTDKLKNEMAIVPVIYIENAVLKNTDVNKTDTLADNIVKSVHAILKSQKLNANEVQIDCDWTESTRDKYFQVLRSIKNKTRWKLGATIRLHQVKYKEKTGVPPIDYGLLMYYNMGQLNTNANTNSIYSAKTASLYKDYIYSYPLDLDVALGLFSWGVHSRNGKGVRLINNWNKELIVDDHHFKVTSANNYICIKDTVVNQSMIYVGDLIKIEETSSEELLNIASELNEEIKNDSISVIFYHLDDFILKNYETKKLENIYTTFN
ncbi:MAG: hypothetical protein ACK5B3_02445 [Bacteroidota bacterium]